MLMSPSIIFYALCCTWWFKWFTALFTVCGILIVSFIFRRSGRKIEIWERSKPDAMSSRVACRLYSTVISWNLWKGTLRLILDVCCHSHFYQASTNVLNLFVGKALKVWNGLQGMWKKPSNWNLHVDAQRRLCSAAVLYSCTWADNPK